MGVKRGKGAPKNRTNKTDRTDWTWWTWCGKSGRGRPQSKTLREKARIEWGRVGGCASKTLAARAVLPGAKKVGVGLRMSDPLGDNGGDW